MKKGDKYQYKKDRSVVYIVETYKEAESKKTVVRYRHPGLKNRSQIGAMYKDVFTKEYKKAI